MSVRLDKQEFRLFGNCDKCGAELYCIEIETGDALCSSEACGITEKFDPAEFANAEPA